MRRILEYYFLQLCGYEGSDIRELVLEKEENRKMFIKQVEGQKPDMTDYQLASSLLAYINNPNGISDGLNYVEDCDDVEAYKRVFKMIFEALHQSQHYEMDDRARRSCRKNKASVGINCKSRMGSIYRKGKVISYARHTHHRRHVGRFPD